MDKPYCHPGVAVTDCPRCEVKVAKGMKFCPMCGINIYNPEQMHQSSFITLPWKSLIAGFLILLASIYLLMSGMNFIRWSTSNDININLKDLIYLSMGLLLILGFFVGLFGSLDIFKRRNYEMVFKFSIYVLICSIIPMIVYSFDISRAVIYAVLGLVFLHLARNEFDYEFDYGRFIDDFFRATPVRTPMYHVPKTLIAQELRDLKMLKDEDVITEEEYEAKRQKLVDQL